MSSKASWKRAAVIAVCCLTVAVATGCSLIPKEEPVLKPPLVKPEKQNYDLYDVKKGTITDSLTGTASFEPVTVKNQQFQVAGRIVAVNVKLKDTVKKGDVLVQLDVEGLDIALKEKERDLLQAQYALAEAKKTDDAQLQKIRGLELEIAQSNRNELQKQLKGKEFVAEMDGVVTFTETMKTGDYVQLNKTYVTIVDPSVLRMAYAITNPNDARKVQVGMAADVKYGGGNIEAKVVQAPSSAPATEDKQLAAKFAKTIYLEFASPPAKVPDVNATADFKITLAKKENVLVIPKQAIMTFQDRSTVKILDGESIKEVDVEKGIESSTEVEISKGLSEGQKLILP